MNRTTVNRLKRLEASTGLGEKRYYMLSPDVMTVEEWSALYCSGEAHETVYELKPLMPGSYVRRYSHHIRSGPLATCLADLRNRQNVGQTPAQFWVCGNDTEAYELIREISVFSHAYVFTDIADEMRLGPGRHRIDQ
jgi:hypothetical protein